MKYNMYVIRDVKTGFLTPTLDQNDDSAKRNFAYACNNAESLMYFAPNDYAIYCIGQYESDTAEIITEIPRIICQATDVIRKETNENENA